MQKVQLADRLGNVETRKVGFSFLHFLLGPIYSFIRLRFFLGLFECLLIYYFCPLPGMDFLVELINKIPNIPTSGTRTNLTVSYGSLLTVNGNVDKEVLPSLKTILQESYQYTQKNLAQDAMKVGMSRTY